MTEDQAAAVQLASTVLDVLEFCSPYQVPCLAEKANKVLASHGFADCQISATEIERRRSLAQLRRDHGRHAGYEPPRFVAALSGGAA